MNNKCKHDAKVIERQTKATNRYNELDEIFKAFNNCKDKTDWHEVMNGRYNHPVISESLEIEKSHKQQMVKVR